MKSPLIQNETDYDARVVNGIIRYVFRHLDLDGARVMVKVKNLRQRNKCYSGRFYSQPHFQTRIYSDNGYGWTDVGPTVPRDIKKLIVCRIGSPDFYPRSNYVYKRKDSPGTWMLNDWREALVSVAAHEAMHLRQDRGKGSAAGRFNEIDTEWAAFRIHGDWVADQAKKDKKVAKQADACAVCGDESVAELSITYDEPSKEQALALLCEGCASTMMTTAHPHL